MDPPPYVRSMEAVRATKAPIVVTNYERVRMEILTRGHSLP